MEIFLLERKAEVRGVACMGYFYCFILSGGSCQNVIIVKNGIRYAPFKQGRLFVGHIFRRADTIINLHRRCFSTFCFVVYARLPMGTLWALFILGVGMVFNADLIYTDFKGTVSCYFFFIFLSNYYKETLNTNLTIYEYYLEFPRVF